MHPCVVAPCLHPWRSHSVPRRLQLVSPLALTFPLHRSTGAQDGKPLVLGVVREAERRVLADPKQDKARTRRTARKTCATSRSMQPRGLGAPRLLAIRGQRQDTRRPRFLLQLAAAEPRIYSGTGREDGRQPEPVRHRGSLHCICGPSPRCNRCPSLPAPSPHRAGVPGHGRHPRILQTEVSRAPGLGQGRQHRRRRVLARPASPAALCAELWPGAPPSSRPPPHLPRPPHAAPPWRLARAAGRCRRAAVLPSRACRGRGPSG